MRLEEQEVQFGVEKKLESSIDRVEAEGEKRVSKQLVGFVDWLFDRL